MRKPYYYYGKDGLWICYGSNDWPSACIWMVFAYDNNQQTLVLPDLSIQMDCMASYPSCCHKAVKVPLRITTEQKFQ